MDRDRLHAASMAAHQRATQLDHEITAKWPGCWRDLDRMRRSNQVSWPDWCLLPMGAPAAIVTSSLTRPPGSAIAAMSALYAWRFAGSVYLFEPELQGRLLSNYPDALDGVADLVGLPQWCVYVAEHSDSGISGLWMHLEHDANTGRPELRILLDTDPSQGLAGLHPIPVYLDRPSITEALADMRATTIASIGGKTGQNVHGGELDAAAAELAERVERYVAMARYLCQPEADIRSLSGTSARPRRSKSPVLGRETWLVGYGE